MFYSTDNSWGEQLLLTFMSAMPHKSTVLKHSYQFLMSNISGLSPSRSHWTASSVITFTITIFHVCDTVVLWYFHKLLDRTGSTDHTFRPQGRVWELSEVPVLFTIDTVLGHKWRRGESWNFRSTVGTLCLCSLWSGNQNMLLLLLLGSYSAFFKYVTQESLLATAQVICDWQTEAVIASNVSCRSILWKCSPRLR